MAKLVGRNSRIFSWKSLFSGFQSKTCLRTISGSSGNACITGQDADPFSWPDSSLGKLSPKDPRFPLPGQVGSCHSLRPPTIPENHLGSPVLLDLLNPSYSSTSSVTNDLFGLEALDSVECKVLDCPKLLRKDFAQLFSQGDAKQANMTVIVLSQQAVNSMLTWSPAVDQEREELLERYMKGAQYLCQVLKSYGYFADFIDPSSGKPFNSEPTSLAFFETDERYKLLGFDIEDHGCCKVISHHLWGTHAYIGCLYTTAPCDHPVFDYFKDSH